MKVGGRAGDSLLSSRRCPWWKMGVGWRGLAVEVEVVEDTKVARSGMTSRGIFGCLGTHSADGYRRCEWMNLEVEWPLSASVGLR